MKVQIYGSGCDKCRKLAANAETAARELGIEIELEKVSDINAITDAGVMMTPALAINGKVVSSGKVLSPEEIGKRLTAAMTGASAPCCCAGSPGTTAPDACCCSSDQAISATGSCCGGSGVSRKILTVLLLALVLFSIAAMVVREMNSRNEAATAVPVPADAVVVYYFHGTQRCMTCNRIARAFGTCYTRRNCCIELKFSLDWKIRIFCFGFGCSITHLIYILTFTGTKCRVA